MWVCCYSTILPSFELLVVLSALVAKFVTHEQ